MFDLFDANCMEEFKKIENFERTHCHLFANYSVGNEFTLSQGNAHHEFCDLFELLCSNFLILDAV